MDAFLEKRKKLVNLLRDKGIKNEKVLESIMQVPRHMFVPSFLQYDCYMDKALPIGNGQTISQPYIVALMTELVYIRNNMKILEIGTGSGYQAAVLANLSEVVYTIEKLPTLFSEAKNRLKTLKYDNVLCKLGDGTIGWEKDAPYDGIIVTAGAPYVPEPLFKQLKEDGVLVIPEGESLSFQELNVYKKNKNGTIEKHSYGECAFVPLKGKYGWENGA